MENADSSKLAADENVPAKQVEADINQLDAKIAQLRLENKQLRKMSGINWRDTATAATNTEKKQVSARLVASQQDNAKLQKLLDEYKGKNNKLALDKSAFDSLTI